MSAQPAITAAEESVGVPEIPETLVDDVIAHYGGDMRLAVRELLADAVISAVNFIPPPVYSLAASAGDGCLAMSVEGRRRRGTDLVPGDDYIRLAPEQEHDDSPLEHTFRIEVWDEAPEDGGSLLETISRATDFSVSMAAYRAALRARPGKVLVHLNGRHLMGAEKAQDSPRPLFVGRAGGSGRFLSQPDSGRLPHPRQARAMVSARR